MTGPPPPPGRAGRKDRWYQHVPPATAVIPCEGAQHHVTWRWGKYKLDDHDLGGERAMLQLGGEPCACLQALNLWANLFGMHPEYFGEMRRRMGADAALLPKEFDVPREVGMALSVERAWKKSLYFDRQGQLLERQLRDLAMPAIRAHLAAEKQRLGSRVIRNVKLNLVPAGREVSIRGRMDTVSVSADVTLSSAWIVHVWSRGIGVVDGALVMAVLGPGSTPGGVAVKAARWEPTEPGISEPKVIRAEVVPGAAGGDGWDLRLSR